MAKKKKIDIICPKCGNFVENYRCRFCGATKSINPVSGNVIWMINGRIVGAFQDEKQAWIKSANIWGIEKNKWPKKFKEN